MKCIILDAQCEHLFNYKQKDIYIFFFVYYQTDILLQWLKMFLILLKLPEHVHFLLYTVPCIHSLKKGEVLGQKYYEYCIPV